MSTSEDLAKDLDLLSTEQDIFAKARLIHKIKKSRALSTKDIAIHMKTSSSYVCHLLRLNKLPLLVVDGYMSGTISISHLFIISRLKLEEHMIAAYEKVLAENFTVAATEEEVRKLLYNTATVGTHLSQEDKESLKSAVSKILPSADVKIIQTRTRAKLIVELKGSLQQTTNDLIQLEEQLK